MDALRSEAGSDFLIFMGHCRAISGYNNPVLRRDYLVKKTLLHTLGFWWVRVWIRSRLI